MVKLLAILLAVSSLVTGILAASAQESGPGEMTQSYLPLMMNEYPLQPTATPHPNIMLGVIPKDYWQPMVQDAINNELIPVDNWSGKRHSLAGVFHSFDQYNTVSNMLPIIWDNGYTPFVNIYTTASAYTVASGGIDSQIRAWARGFAVFANGGQRMAYLAPLQEMDGYWVPYGLDPYNYIVAFRRIHQIFLEEGVPPESVQWVFSPNGWTRASDPVFESYYPGDAYVDVVSFSAYNFGYHPYNPFKDWLTPAEVLTPYVTRFQTLTPAKPIFIAQGGTTAYYSTGYNVEKKNQWLRDAYTLLADLPGVRGVIYYNDNDPHIIYDWAFYRPGGVVFTGYQEGVAHDVYQYISPSDLMNTDLTP